MNDHASMKSIPLPEVVARIVDDMKATAGKKAVVDLHGKKLVMWTSTNSNLLFYNFEIFHTPDHQNLGWTSSHGDFKYLMVRLVEKHTKGNHA